MSPPSTPAQSPLAGRSSAAAEAVAALTSAPGQNVSVGSEVRDFFEDELRGYRLLKSTRISQQERQNVLTQTSNSTSFHQIRRVCRRWRS